MLRLGMPESTTESLVIATPAPDRSVMRTMFRNINLNETNAMDWLAVEAISLDHQPAALMVKDCIGEYCNTKCDGESCSARCTKFSCTQSINGEYKLSTTTWEEAYPQYSGGRVPGEDSGPGVLYRPGESGAQRHVGPRPKAWDVDDDDDD
ncbi:unnamed protein product [Arctia plantaginis]|uniref:Uncharacterized protein n=1 Tax=Arctia plantaginis TaxID=874455 RepID=A0A8S1ADU5_ARCPL|nr:unnamed protein product [Arctia plantaginis]